MDQSKAPPVATEAPPPPLPIEEAFRGLSAVQIAANLNRTHTGVFYAIRRLKVLALEFHGRRLYSPAQADFVKRHMRQPDRHPRPPKR